MKRKREIERRISEKIKEIDSNFLRNSLKSSQSIRPAHRELTPVEASALLKPYINNNLEFSLKFREFWW